MDMNIIVAGVGGQGILSIAFVLDHAAMKEGYRFKQSEVHGMAQRGGAVQSHLRFSKDEIWSDLIPQGGADLILSVEPLEALRYFSMLKEGGAVIASASPFVNIPNYPDLEEVYGRIASLRNHTLIHSERLAKLAGSAKAQNIVMLGAAARLLPFNEESCLEFVELLFKAKGEQAVGTNLAAFKFGQAMSAFFGAGLEAGISPERVRRLCRVADPENLEPKSLPAWKEAFDRHPDLFSDGAAEGMGIPGTEAAAREAMEKGKM